MKYTLAIATVLVAAIAGNALAEEGQVSQAQLAEMGLPGMTAMSDAQGTEIRGQGFAFAASISGSAVPGSFNLSPAAALGRRSAFAASGSTSQIEGGGFYLGTGGFGVFGFRARVGSAGFAYARSR